MEVESDRLNETCIILYRFSKRICVSWRKSDSVLLRVFLQALVMKVQYGGEVRSYPLRNPYFL